MSLSCDCDEGPEFMREIERTARKRHECCECGCFINPSESYRFISGKWDGAIYSFKHCEACADLWDSMMALGFCMEYGSLRQDHADYVHLYEPPPLLRNSNG